MIAYLDINHIIDLSKDENKAKLEELVTLFQEKGISLGISFAHIAETIKIQDYSYSIKPIVDVIDRFSMQQLTFNIDIFDAEIANEFYLYLKLPFKKRNVNPIGPIFKKFEIFNNYAEIISRALKIQGIKEATTSTLGGYEGKVRKSFKEDKKMPFPQALKRERLGFLEAYQERLIKEIVRNLRIQLLPKSINFLDFVKTFDFDRCPYVNLYTKFVSKLYLNTKRDPSGDLADHGHVSTAVMVCDYFVTERNNAGILNELINQHQVESKSKVYSSLDDFIESLK